MKNLNLLWNQLFTHTTNIHHNSYSSSTNNNNNNNKSNIDIGKTSPITPTAAASLSSPSSSSSSTTNKSSFQFGKLSPIPVVKFRTKLFGKFNLNKAFQQDNNRNSTVSLDSDWLHHSSLNDDDDDDQQINKNIIDDIHLLTIQRRAISCIDIDNNTELDSNNSGHIQQQPKQPQISNKINNRVSFSKSPTSPSSSSLSSCSAISCSSPQLTYNPNYQQQQQQQQQQKALPFLQHYHYNKKYRATSSCVLSNLSASTRKILDEIIREEEEEEEEDDENNDEEQEEDSVQDHHHKQEETPTKMFETRQQTNDNDGGGFPIKPFRHHRSKQSSTGLLGAANKNPKDRIEPFQKPDDLNAYWQEPKESLYVAKQQQNDDNVIHRRYSINDNDEQEHVILRMSDPHRHHGHHHGSMPDDNISSSNFLRINNLRSSCPPPTRIRRKSSSSGGGDSASRLIKSTNSHYYGNSQLFQHQRSSGLGFGHNSGQGGDNRTGFVDVINNKLSNAMRKSWLSSFFHSFNSKEKQSKWKKSDDFEAEFFIDRQSDSIAESLLNRRSPLQYLNNNNFNNSNKNNDNSTSFERHKNQQMAPTYDKNQQLISTSSTRTSTNSSSTTTTTNSNTRSNNYNWVENAIHEPPPPPTQPQNILQNQHPQPSFIRPNSSALLLKPRPRSACLDNTYMLRMRNGSFIEYNLDSEGKDESCSIISSHQHLATNGSGGGGSNGDFFSSRSSINCSSTAALNELNNNNKTSSNQHQYLSPRSSALYRNNNNNHNQINLRTAQQEDNKSPVSHSVRSNSMISSTSASLSPKSSFNKSGTASAMVTSVTSSPSSSSATTTSVTTASSSTLSTTSSSILLTNSNINPHNINHYPLYKQDYSLSTKTSYSSFDDNRIHNNNNNNMEDSSIFTNIYWPVKNCTRIQIQPEHTAYDVINQMLTSQIYLPHNLSIRSRNNNPPAPNLPLPNQAHQYAYALRLIDRNCSQTNDCIWIHPTKNIMEFMDQNQWLIGKGWKFQLRIRYIPANLEELYRTDFLSFKFLYEQILEEFLSLELTQTELLSNQDLILELSCYEIYRTHPYLTPQGLEKSSNWDALENNFHRIFPPSFINSMKTKTLRKMIKGKYKKIHTMSQESVVFQFLKLVLQLINYNREVFHCSLGESTWCVPVDLMIGPTKGIAYFTSKSSPATVIVKSFDLIEQVNIVSYSTMNKNNNDKSNDNGEDSYPVNNSGTSKKILLNIRIKNEDDPLVLTCSSFSMAQSIADLIDGYHRLVTNNPESIWLNVISDKPRYENNAPVTTTTTNDNDSSKSSLRTNSSEIIEPKRADFDLFNTPSKIPFDVSSSSIRSPETIPEDTDYSNPVEVCLEIKRSNLRIEEILGNGQFGDVHKGVYLKPGKDKSVEEEIPVAIKISRADNSSIYGRHEIHMTDQKLLCEAERMHKLDHHHIIKLIGVCSISPVYIIMELAEYGELRNFLMKNGAQLEQRRLINYSCQIASAMAYLEFKQFVHRDIAARNVLVFSFDCVKLADFGLSRYIEDTSYYMATNSKLPIKWMAPESINFRRFTTASDVWMFGVCVWEIFMLGKKPFPGIKNSDVLGLIECGDRLSKPSRCPEQLYELLLKCWRYEPDRRPTFRTIKKKINDVYQNELGLIGAIARIDTSNDLYSSKSSLSSYSAKDPSSSSSSSLSRMHLQASKTTNNNSSYRLSLADNNKIPNLSHSESNLSLNASHGSGALDPAKIKEILDEQRRQMVEDQRWLQQNEMKWQTNLLTASPSSSPTLTNHHNDLLLPKTNNGCDSQESERTSTTTPSIYEDARCDNNKNDSSNLNQTPQHLNVVHLYSQPNKHPKSASARNSGCGGDESYNSFHSTKSSFEQNSSPSTSSSIDSSKTSDNDCGLQVSLKKFFKHNRLSNAKVREEMMEKVNCASIDMDRKEDPCYWSTINVVNSVRYLLKGIQEFTGTTDYIDLVKNVGLELRNLLANVDIFLETIPNDDKHRKIITVAQKKLSTDMNDLVESMKKTITYSDTPMEGAYKQNMLESSYVLVIDSKNLMDTVDEVRLKLKNYHCDNLSC